MPIGKSRFTRTLLVITVYGVKSEALVLQAHATEHRASEAQVVIILCVTILNE